MARKKDVPKTMFNFQGKDIEIEEKEYMKYEVAQEIGVLEKALDKGWKSLSAKESGKIGGIISKRHKENKREDL